MLTIGIFRSRGLVAAVMAVFSLMIIPVASYSQSAPPKSGSLTGFVYGADMKTPVADATVKVRNLNTQKEYTSPTDKTGMYKIAEIDEGWYALTVSSILGEYSLNYGVYIKSGEKAKLILSMKGAGVLEGKGLGSNAGKS
ncbi:MAG: carboxypeptidase-like regulatory domain-containing protein, partial [Acidobacteriota bacterium]